MILNIKQLEHNKQIIVPQTVAEAVLVKRNNTVIRLDEALASKQDIITAPAGSGLSIYQQTGGTIITHSNNINSNEAPQQLLIKHDSHGHIVETQTAGKITITLNGAPIIESGTSTDQTLNLGDDFKLDSNNIQLTITEL